MNVDSKGVETRLVCLSSEEDGELHADGLAVMRLLISAAARSTCGNSTAMEACGECGQCLAVNATQVIERIVTSECRNTAQGGFANDVLKQCCEHGLPSGRRPPRTTKLEILVHLCAKFVIIRADVQPTCNVCALLLVADRDLTTLVILSRVTAPQVDVHLLFPGAESRRFLHLGENQQAWSR